MLLETVYLQCGWHFIGAEFNVVTFHPKAVLVYENMIKTYGFEEKALANPASSSSLLGLRLSEAFKFPEHSDRKLAVKSTGGTELVEDEDFLFRGSFLITEKDSLDVFFFHR